MLRTGDVKAVQDTLDRLRERYAEKNKDGFDALRVLVRAQNSLVSQAYMPFLREATTYFKLAIANEEIPRPKLPEVVLAIAESHRRLGNLQAAMSWYTGLACMSETQPRIRAEIRAAEGVPGAQASHALMLGWRADEEIEAQEMYSCTVKNPSALMDMLRAIIHLGMGTEVFQSGLAANPWRDKSATEALMRQAGKALLTMFPVVWPQTHSMWVEGYVRDRNMLNRFYCPVTGEKLHISLPQNPLFRPRY